MAIKHFPDLCSPDIELLKHVAKVVFFLYLQADIKCFLWEKLMFRINS